MGQDLDVRRAEFAADRIGRGGCPVLVYGVFAPVVAGLAVDVRGDDDVPYLPAVLLADKVHGDLSEHPADLGRAVAGGFCLVADGIPQSLGGLAVLRQLHKARGNGMGVQIAEVELAGAVVLLLSLKLAAVRVHIIFPDAVQADVIAPVRPVGGGGLKVGPGDPHGLQLLCAPVAGLQEYAPVHQRFDVLNVPDPTDLFVVGKAFCFHAAPPFKCHS